MKIWALRICLLLFASSCAFAIINNRDELTYTTNTTINDTFYNYSKITINQGVKVTYNGSFDNRDNGYFENNGEIIGSMFSNASGTTFINNGKMTISQFNNRSATATFYGDASISGSSAGMAQFGNRGGGTFSIIGATLTGDMEHDDIYNYKGEAVVKATNTLIFGICDLSNSAKCGYKMGQLNGNFINKGTSSVINVNIANMEYGRQYQIITGTITGIDSISFMGANLGEVTTHYDITKGLVWVEKKSQPEKPEPNPDKPTPPPPAEIVRVKSNTDIIKEAIDDKFNDKVAAFDKAQGASDLDSTLQQSFITQPKAMLNAFKNSLSQTPINSTYTSKFIAANDAVRYDNGYTPSPFQSQMQVFAAPFATHLRASGLNGTLFGFAAGLGYFDEYIAQAHFAYAHGASEQNLDTQSTAINADLLQMAGFSRLFYGKAELDLSADLIWGKFSAENSWFDDSTMNFDAKFNNYQANFGATLGWRFGGDFSLKPFAGAQIRAEKQDEFRQNGGLNLQSKAYNELVFGWLIGLETRYIFENGAFIFAKAQYESFNEKQNEHFRLNGKALRYESYKNVASVSVGGRIFSANSFTIDIQALYQRYNDGLNALGGNAAFRWSF